MILQAVLSEGWDKHRECPVDDVLASLNNDCGRPSKLCQSPCGYKLRYLRFGFQKFWLLVIFTSLLLEVVGIHKKNTDPKDFRTGTQKLAFLGLETVF